MSRRKKQEAVLTNRTNFRVRFSEVDSMKIVWHGEYVKYFEDGREAFGREFEGLGYLDIQNSGFLAPVVELNLEYKKSLRCGEKAIVETRYINTEAAKICFEYSIFREGDGELIATGSSIQVFTDQEGELQLLSPAYYLEWKKKWIKHI